MILVVCMWKAKRLNFFRPADPCITSDQHTHARTHTHTRTYTHACTCTHTKVGLTTRDGSDQHLILFSSFLSQNNFASVGQSVGHHFPSLIEVCAVAAWCGELSQQGCACCCYLGEPWHRYCFFHSLAAKLLYSLVSLHHVWNMIHKNVHVRRDT